MRESDKLLETLKTGLDKMIIRPQRLKIRQQTITIMDFETGEIIAEHRLTGWQSIADQITFVYTSPSQETFQGAMLALKIVSGEKEYQFAAECIEHRISAELIHTLICKPMGD